MNFKTNISLIVVNNSILNNENSDTYSSFFNVNLNTLGFIVSKICVIPTDIKIITQEIILSNREYDITIIVSDLSNGTVNQAIGKTIEQKLIKNQQLENLLKKNNVSFSDDELLLPIAANILEAAKYPLIQIQRFFLIHENHMNSIFETVFKQYLINYKKPRMFKKIANIYPNGNSVELGKLKNGLIKYDLTKTTKNSFQLTYESQSLKDIIEFEDNLKHLVLVSSTKPVMSDTVYSDVNTLVMNSLQVIESCFLKYGPENTFICFNGGKDCTVLLHLTMVVLEKHYPCFSQRPICLYVQGPKPFMEQEEFVDECQELYSLNIIRHQMDIKTALKTILGEHSNLKACLMGTRRTDPFSKNLGDFQMTDPDYPEVMRVSPLLNWSYFQIWNYLLYYKISYCTLYDMGYTSLGNIDNTVRNPFLLYNDVMDGQDKYLPAYKLLKEDSERYGRK
ncbi:hypothetical protein WA026_022223 [Henosepilachna vigintioctopunctata]|uniref:FAD synthase n=1 Tax=Henosepilachna vigintioctopunctata TaxID=420089 RepID=A0AAW1UJB2_9CUCU